MDFPNRSCIEGGPEGLSLRFGVSGGLESVLTELGAQLCLGKRNTS